MRAKHAAVSTAPKNRSALKRWGIALAAVALAGAVAPAALADEVYNTVDATIDANVEVLNLTPSSPDTTVKLGVNPTSSGTKGGCDLTGQTTLTVSVKSSNTAVSTVSPSSVIFNGCAEPPKTDNLQSIVVHPVGVGDSTITVTQTATDTGATFDTAPATFTVHVANVVQPNTPPTLHLPSPITVEATGPAGATVAYTATATDTEDGTDPVVCSPLSGAAFPVGTTTVSCSATDKGGLTTPGTFTVTVTDTTAPAVTIDTSAVKAGTGWYNAASSGTAGVTIHVAASDIVDASPAISCTDNGNPIMLGGGNKTLVDGVHNVHCTATDSSGNTGSADATFQVDQTLPTITAAYAPPANGGGWNNSNVTVSYTCSDATSHIAAGTCPADDSVTTEGSTSLNRSVTDQAGNTASGSWLVKLDKTAPSIVGSVDRAANGSGWYNAPVTVTFACGDGTGSGVQFCTAPVTLSTDGAGQHADGTATDYADNQNSATVGGINIDQTAPHISYTRTPSNGAGWNSGNVTVTFSCTDAGGSDVASVTDPVTVSTEGANQSVTGYCTDNAGNTDRVTVDGINIDKTKPVITGSRTPLANKFGWTNADVTVGFTCSDGSGSGLATNNVAGGVVSSEGQNQQVKNTGTCVDLAGNVADPATVDHISIDKAQPVISGTANPPANTDGWNNTDVSVSFSCGDTGAVQAGIDVDTVGGGTTLGEGAEQSVTSTGQCIDKAGNEAVAPVTVGGINVDETKPVIGTTRLPAANANGWNNTDVSVSFSCGDSGTVQSGIATDTVGGDRTLTEGAGQSVTNTGDCVDKAGNAADSATVERINIDETKPVITGTASPAANPNGWNNTTVTVNWSCTEAGATRSGIDATSSVPNSTVSTEGAGQTATSAGTCKDLAGNSADQGTLGGINIDETAPTATITADRAPDHGIWYNHMVTLTTTGNADDLSGIDTCTEPQLYSAVDNAAVTEFGYCTDKAGNTSGPASVTFAYDATKPNLSPSVSPNPVLLNGSAAASAGASDPVSDVASSSCGSVNTNAVGTGQTVSCTATDNAGNTSNANATYAVVYASTGNCLGSPGHQVLQPVNADGTSVFKLNSTVPVKFRVCDANGNSISTPGLVKSFQLVSRQVGTTVSAVNEDPVSTTPDTAFRWSSTDQQWIFNLATKGQVTGSRLTYEIDLNDGSTIRFSFSLK